MKILYLRTDRPLVYGSVFFVSWWIGAIAMLAGLEGSLVTGMAACLFGIACAVWWCAYRMSNFSSQAGFVVIAVWGLGPLGTLIDIKFYAGNAFLWISSAMLVALVVAASAFRTNKEEERAARDTGAIK